jgi:signal transduction histidine kinase
MTGGQWLQLLSATSQLVLALLCLTRGQRNPLARALALLCFDVAGWTLAALLHGLTHREVFSLIDHGLSPWTAPLALDFVLRFVGRRRALRYPLALVYALTGALAATSAIALVWPPLRSFVGSPAWAIALFSAAIPSAAFEIIALVAHLQRNTDPREEWRTRLILGSTIVGTLFGATEELDAFLPGTPQLGSVGILISTLPLGLVTLDFRVFEQSSASRASTYALATLGLGAIVYLAAVQNSGTIASLFILGTVLVGLLLVLASRRWIVDAALRKERLAHMATLGRFSAQMAHDLKNPLGALRGSLQLMEGDQPAGAHLQRALRQVDRLTAIVDTYGRMSRIEPVLCDQPLRPVLEGALANVPKPPGITVHAHLGAATPNCLVDQELLASVFENLIRNAFDALGEQGALTVRLSHEAESAGVTVAFEDDGPGMSEATRERAFDDFFTTKPQGSGLGLAFARRVVEAHNGRISLRSRVGHGTTVVVWLRHE